VKVDNCGGARWPALNTSWINIRAGLDKYCGGRPVILSVETCGSPAPTACGGWIRNSGATMWRTTDDLQLYWTSVLSNLDGNENMAPIAGPGYYNDPDMLIIGKPALSYPESQSHLFGWAISAAPLLLSFDITSAAARTDEVMTLLTAPEVLAVDQDPAVVQGVRVTPHNATGTECWARPLVTSSGNDTAVLYLNRGNAPADLTCQWELVAPGVLGNHSAAIVRDLFQRVNLGTFTGNYTAVAIPAHGSVFVKLTPA
jgi:alpha-galactosidase